MRCAARTSLPRRRTLAMPVVVALAAMVAGCGSGKPPTPAWQLSAAGSLERYTQAMLSGDTRVASAEFARARSALASTGDATLVARAELTRCALQVASLRFERCDSFEALGGEVAVPEQVYARYLQGAPLAASELAQLPQAHRRVAGARPEAAARTLAAIDDPVARIVAAGVVLRGGRGDAELLQVAVDTATAQGWRLPLAAWLRAQMRLAEQRGQPEEVQRLRRRIELVTGATAPGAPSAP